MSNQGKSAIDLINVILKSCRGGRRVLLIELGPIDSLLTAHENRTLENLCCIARKAVAAKWTVVVASSSGRGWINSVSRSTVFERDALRVLETLENQWNHQFTSCFTEREALRYMQMHNIEHEFRDRLHVITGWNPYLLSLFQKILFTGKGENSRVKAGE